MCIKMFQVYIKRYQVYQKVSDVSNVSIKCIRYIKKYQVYRRVLGVSNYISNKDICDILSFNVCAELCFCYFRK